MRIIVCAKQVPDTTEVRIDPKTNTLIREGVPSILNPDDANALEAALKIKDEYPETVVSVISMGPPQAENMLRECLAMGADEAYLISDRAFGGSDTWATSNALASACRKFEKFDFIFGGRQAIDGDKSMTVQRQLEDGYEVIEVSSPAMLTAVKELNDPRYMRVDRIFDAMKMDITRWSIDDLDVSPTEVGLKASPTRVARSFTPEPKGKSVILEGTVKEMVENLAVKFKHQHII